MSDINKPSDENAGEMDDLWADALKEQKAPATPQTICGPMR